MSEEIQEIPQPIQSVQPVPVEPKKKSKLTLIAILLIVILLIAGGVYAGMQLEKKKVKVWTEPPLTVVTPQPTEIPDETANWKTYTTKTFSIKYPNIWNEPSPFLQSTRTASVFDPSNLEIVEGSYYDQSLGRVRTYEEEVAIMEKNAVGKMNVTVVGKTTTKYINKIGESTTEESVLLQTPDKLNLWVSMPIPPETDPKLFDQILSTFKFTDQKETKFTCPQNGWVDCMPIMDEKKKLACSSEAEGWYKINCPNFKGFAQ